jgi:2-iminobutanoate/2-iminopropanoate deaminase
MSRVAIQSNDSPAPLGPYSRAVHAPGGDYLYVSGQTPIDPVTDALVDGDIGVQTMQVFANITVVLAEAGLTLDDVIKVNVYLISMDDFAEMNAAYAQAFSTPYPARTTVAVAALPRGARVEMEFVAARD